MLNRPARMGELAWLRWFYAHSSEEERCRLKSEFVRFTDYRLPADYEYELDRPEEGAD